MMQSLIASWSRKWYAYIPISAAATVIFTSVAVSNAIRAVKTHAISPYGGTAGK
jgi:hypothetical protein